MAFEIPTEVSKHDEKRHVTFSLKFRRTVNRQPWMIHANSVLPSFPVRAYSCVSIETLLWIHTLFVCEKGIRNWTVGYITYDWYWHSPYRRVQINGRCNIAQHKRPIQNRLIFTWVKLKERKRTTSAGSRGWMLKIHVYSIHASYDKIIIRPYKCAALRSFI